jgi:hypothetical protein
MSAVSVLKGSHWRFVAYSLSSIGRFEPRRRMEEDRWVVCHSPLILLQFDSHVNVEYGASSELPVYLYKYFYKGPDFTGFKIDKSTPAQAPGRPSLQPTPGVNSG